jgi:hypothetical protein
MHSTHRPGLPDSKASPSRLRAALRVAVVALISLVGAGFGASACLNRPLCDKDCRPKTTNIFVDQIVQKSVDKIDLLFMIDNSISMADKQKVLAQAVPDLVQRLVSPNCVDPMTGAPNGMPVDYTAQCPGKLIREFTPIRNIHVGIITSSIGGHGSTLCAGSDMGSLEDQEKNDHGWLIGKRPRFMVPAGGVAADAQGFLNWNPDDLKTETQTSFTTTFTAMTTAAGEFGCGLESQLEAIYRFLIDPNPYNTIVTQNCPGTTEPCAYPQGTDDNLIAQRKAFLRPDSLVAIIMMTDENDCSIQESGQFYYAARDNIILPHGAAVCAQNPNDKCCYFCSAAPPAGCPADPTCAMATPRDQDQPNLRCFHQLQRFGYNFLYPVERYVNAFTQTQLCTSRPDLAPDQTNCRDANNDRSPDLYPNPLFQSGTAVPRDASLIFVAGIVGVPYQDLQTTHKPDGSGDYDPAELHYRTAQQLVADNVWPVILGDDNPGNNAPPVFPTDGLMIESKDVRGGVDGENPPQPLQGLNGGYLANKVNGHEWANMDQDDLQYACIFPLGQQLQRDCTQVLMQTPTPGCDCKPDHIADNNPLCQAQNGQYSTTQTFAKAYPGLRELSVLQKFGDNSIVASICAKNLGDKTAQDYGYRPAVDAIVDRLKEALTGRCLPRTLTPDVKTGAIPCSIVEVRNKGTEGGVCDMTKGRSQAGADIITPVKTRLKDTKKCDVDGKPTCDSLYYCTIKQSMDPSCHKDQTPADIGWCYVDPENNPEDDASLVAKCRATERRIIRFIDPQNDTPAHDATVLIACFGSTLPEN